jgi:hypothetical protein
MKTTQYGRALKEYLEEELKIIGDVSKCESWDDTLGRKNAILLVRKLFSFLEEEETKPKTPTQYK